MLEIMALIGIAAVAMFLGAVASQLAWCISGVNRNAERAEVAVGVIVAGLALIAGIAFTF